MSVEKKIPLYKTGEAQKKRAFTTLTTSRTVQKKKITSIWFEENYIQIRCQMKNGYNAVNLRIGLMKNAPTQMLIMFLFIVTPTTTCKNTVTYSVYVTNYPKGCNKQPQEGTECYSMFLE